MLGERPNPNPVNAPLVAMVGVEYRHIVSCCEALIAAGAHSDASSMLFTVIRCCLRTWALALGFASSGQAGSIDGLVRSLRHEMDPDLYVALKRISAGDWDVVRPIEVARGVVEIVYGTPDRPGVLAGQTSTTRPF